MKFITKFKKDWNATTPKVWKAVRDLSLALSISVPTAWVVISEMPKITLPESLGKYAAYLTFGCLILTGLAGTRKTKKK